MEDTGRAAPAGRGRGGTAVALRVATALALVLGVFALVLLLAGKDPLRAYADIFASTLASGYGFSEVLVKMIPLMLTAVAVALPARTGLINVGGEGQLYMGGLVATWGALTFRTWPGPFLLPATMAFGFVGGALWAAVPGIMRAKGWVSETISTLLLNYVAILLVSYAVFGPLKDPESANYPQSAALAAGATLPSFFGTRVHAGTLVAILVLVVYALVMTRTRWGLEMRAIGGNPEAARRNGVAVARYIVVVMLIAGGLAGLAGAGEVSAIHGRLRTSLSPNYGFTGFLISWMAGGHPWGIMAAAFLLAVLTAGGDVLQMTQGLPNSVVLILLALILFVVLARGREGVRR